MLTIIHGEDLAKSRNYFLSERERHHEKVILDGAALTLTDLLQTLSGNGLFGDQQAIFIDELLSKRKASKELDEIIAALTKDQSTPIFLWESKDLTAKQVKPFSKAVIKQFKIPTTVFAFLDALTPQNNKKSLQLFHELLEDEDANFALFMLQRQIRVLLSLHPESTTPFVILGRSKTTTPESNKERSWTSQDDNISEVKRLAPWQKTKLQKQARAFPLEKLLELHERLYQLELSQKTGGLSMLLDQTLDLFLASI